MSNQTSVATLMLLLHGKKKPVEMRLDVLGKVLVNRIIKEHGFKYMNLICKGKVLCPDKRLDEQGVKNRSTIMVVKVTEQGVENDTDELKLQMLKKTQIGLKILSERDSSKDPWMPFLEITDQWGNSLTIPEKERKALILALGFHEKGRSLMKRKKYDYAACHLEMADEEFKRLEPSIQTAVDNFGVLQLDIVWCQRADLKNLKDPKDPTSLDDARNRLQTAEKCFLGCYGKEQERLRLLKGDAGVEQAQVLLLRFYLLQSFLFYLENNYREAQAKLTEVESLYRRLIPDSDKINQVMVLGFTESEARLALRACRGDLHEAVKHIVNRRLEQEKVKKTERQRGQGARSQTNTASGLPLNHDVPVFPPFNSAEEPSASFNFDKEDDMVSDVLMDIPRHEEDYLDPTLEEEREFINEMKTYLSRDGDGSHVTK